jgi:hypothetical protein
MKKVIALFVILAIILGIAVSPIGALASQKVRVAYNPCNAPITYRIDEVDPQFHLTEEQFIQKVQQAANIWNTAYGKEIFMYDPEGKVGINLTFDGRQAINEEISSLEGNVTSKKDDLDAKRAEYEERGRNFEERVRKLNGDIAYWNAQGGAPEEEYNKLVAEQNSLRAEASALNEMAKSLNATTNEFNSNVRELNQSIDTFNEALHQKPEEGVYSEADLRIDIFFNTNENTLIRTIAHELGHARGLDHVENESAVMYEKTFPDYTLTPDDLEELQKACRQRTTQEAFSETLRNTILDLRRKVAN